MKKLKQKCKINQPVKLEEKNSSLIGFLCTWKQVVSSSVVDPHWPNPDPAFYLNADPDSDQTSKSQTVDFYMENTLKVGKR
jgi:hypothetical protein